MTWLGRATLLALVGLANVGAQDGISPVIALVGLGVLVLLAWRLNPGFWRVVLSGLAGGALAGLVILGPGFRLAMRIVAIVDPIETPEFSIGGTLFIVVGIGMFFGAIQAVTGNLVRMALSVRSAVIGGLIVAVQLMIGLVFFSGEISDEIFSFGGGAWMNIPLFGVFAVTFGIAAMALADKFAGEKFPAKSAERVKVPA